MQEVTALQKLIGEQAIQLGADAVADAYLSDPAFAACRADEELWNTTIADGLDNN